MGEDMDGSKIELAEECIEGGQCIVWETSDTWNTTGLNTYICQKCGNVIIQPEDCGSGG